MAANPYDPVTTTDRSQLTDDDDDWSLPQIRFNKFSETSRSKSLCCWLQSHKKKIFAGIAAALFVLIIIIIAVAVSHDSGRHPTGDEGKWENPEQGLVFYPAPQDGSIVISFTPYDFYDLKPGSIMKSLNKELDKYDSLKQLDENIFTDCSNSYSPGNKICKVSRNHFGDECTSGMSYGYVGGQPCVFIQLNLPDNVTIKPIGKESHLWDSTQGIINNESDPSFVPVTCKGTAQVDTDILEKTEGHGIQHRRIEYHPEQGLFSYLYRERNTSLPFLKPGVMVHFTALVSRHKVHITCTAWGQLYNNGKMLDHNLLTVHFALYVNQA